jgi:iron(III) transport system permease protein
VKPWGWPSELLMADLSLARPLAGKRFRKGARRAVWPLALAATVVAAFVAVPLIYILVRALTGGSDVWLRLAQTRLLGLFINTLSLTAAVTLGTVFLGVSLAWLTERTDLPGRRIWRWLLAMPLAIPTYIGAVVHLAMLRPRGGYIPQFLSMLAGRPVETPSPFGFWGAAFILTIFMYPYVYLLSAAAFRSIHASLEEASRSLGNGTLKTLWKVVLPVLRPGISAGALLVVLDILAEYGTVALLRYETFSAAIFLQLSGRYDRSAAAVLSGVLLVFAVLVLFGELKLQGRARYEQYGGNWRPARPLALGRWRIPALLGVLGVISLALVVPMTILLLWTWQAATGPVPMAASMQTGSQGLWTFAWNSLWSAALAALLAVLLSLPVALLAVRYPSRVSRAISQLCQVGYALPGVVVALSLILLVNRFLPFLYATPLLVVMAYVLRHMPQAVRSSQAALAQLSPTLEEAAHSLGRTPLKTFIQVTLRIILPGLFSGGALVFLTSLKELPATLLLRPAGFDTLAVRVWIWAGEGIYTQAAPAALLLILAAAGPLYFLLRREKLYSDS